MNAYLTPSGRAAIQAEIEAQRAYLEQLREARANAAMHSTLARAAYRAKDRRFTGERITELGGLS